MPQVLVSATVATNHDVCLAQAAAAAAAGGAGTIPIARTPHDTLREGGRSFKFEARAPHPVETIQSQELRRQWDADLYRVERVYGMAAAWEKRMDRAVLASVARLPGIPSSHIGIDTLLHRHTKIGFEDYLGREWLRGVQALWLVGSGLRSRSRAILAAAIAVPQHSPLVPKKGVHEAMEEAAGMR